MKLLISGFILLTTSCALFLPEERKLTDIEWCILNGDGSAQCKKKLADLDEYLTKNESELKNYVCSNPKDMGDLILECKKNANK